MSGSAPHARSVAARAAIRMSAAEAPELGEIEMLPKWNAAIWRQAQRTQQLSVRPLRKREPIDHAVHSVKGDCSGASRGNEFLGQH